MYRWSITPGASYLALLRFLLQPGVPAPRSAPAGRDPPLISLRKGPGLGQYAEGGEMGQGGCMCLGEQLCGNHST